MTKRSFIVAFLGLASATLLAVSSLAASQAPSKANWIWFDEGNPLRSAPAETIYFRKAFDENYELQEAEIHITCDDEFVLWINGEKVGSGTEWKDGKVFDVKKQLRRGRNVIAVECKNTGGPAGFVAWLVRLTKPGNHYTVVTDGTWKCSKQAPPNWLEPGFDDAKWSSPKALSEFVRPDRWAGITWNGKSDVSRFVVPDGFVVEQLAEPDVTGSIVNMTFDWKGRPVISRERGSLFILEDADDDGKFDKAIEFSDKVKNCQGVLCFDRQTYYAIGDGPEGTGLYRLKDTNSDDRADMVEPLHKFRGGMGEHGPHAIVAGPDGYLYLNAGNHSWVSVEPAASSPVVPWIAHGQLHDKPETDRTVKSAGIDVPLRSLLRGYEADVLPRYEDANGHAAGIRVPGGTIWRLDPDAKNFTLEACGYRNHYDFAFNSLGEIFTFDSDMEWDEFLPWYRPVAVFHSPPGSDHGWRSGSNVSPEYYADYLPWVAATGRGSPCGVIFYNHSAFPEKYHDAMFITDWSYGRIFAVPMKRSGASFLGKAEEFITGKPLNVTDIEVAPDGSMFFTTGGRNTEGGLFRIRTAQAKDADKPNDDSPVSRALDQPQPLSAWGRDQIRQAQEAAGDTWAKELQRAVLDIRADAGSPPQGQRTERRIRALSYMLQFGPEPSGDVVRSLLKDSNDEMRSMAAILIARNPESVDRESINALLDDPSPLVQRRALESLVRLELPGPISKLKPLLASDDRFVRFSALGALERLPVQQWAKPLMEDNNTRVAAAAVIAANKTGAVAADPAIAQAAFQTVTRLWAAKPTAGPELEHRLTVIRALQLTLVNTEAKSRPPVAHEIGKRLLAPFPTGTLALDREISRIAAALIVPGTIDKLLEQLEKIGSTDSLEQRADAIHYARCLAAVPTGWNWQQRQRFLAWYDVSRDWKGGHSYAGYVTNFLRDTVAQLDEKQLIEVVRDADKYQRAAQRAVAADERINEKSDPAIVSLLAQWLDKGSESPIPPADVMLALGRTGSAEAEAALLKQYEKSSGELRDVAIRALTRFQNARNWNIFLRGLESNNKETIRAALSALIGVEQKPEGPAPYRAAIQAANRLGDQTSWDGVVLLRQWAGKHFGHKPNQWRAELDQWQKWYAESYPNAPAAQLAEAAKPQHNWTYDQMLAYLEGAGKTGSVESGKKIFEKAVCSKCHRIDQVGQSIGPDLTTLSSRFKRKDILEAIIYPSRTLSDQYKSLLIATKDGRVITAMRAPDEGDNYVLLLSDASTVRLPKSSVEEMVEGKQSVMPDGLLNQFELQEIADLFAFLESGKPVAPAANGKEK